MFPALLLAKAKNSSPFANNLIAATKSTSRVLLLID
jgi:hypothetical protein